MTIPDHGSPGASATDGTAREDPGEPVSALADAAGAPRGEDSSESDLDRGDSAFGQSQKFEAHARAAIGYCSRGRPTLVVVGEGAEGRRRRNPRTDSNAKRDGSQHNGSRIDEIGHERTMPVTRKAQHSLRSRMGSKHMRSQVLPE
jgi:hypothetical protein